MNEGNEVNESMKSDSIGVSRQNQALERSDPKKVNKGGAAAKAMISVFKTLKDEK